MTNYSKLTSWILKSITFNSIPLVCLYKARTSAEPKSYNTEMVFCNWSKRTTYWLRYKAKACQPCFICNLQDRARINCSPLFTLFAKYVKPSSWYSLLMYTIYLLTFSPYKTETWQHLCLVQIHFISTTSLNIPNLNTIPLFNITFDIDYNFFSLILA